MTTFARLITEQNSGHSSQKGGVRFKYDLSELLGSK